MRKYLIWHSARTGSTLLCDMLSQTEVAGINDFVRCGFPLGAQGKIEPRDFKTVLNGYEESQTTENGVFGCKLSWDGLSKLVQWVGVKPVHDWLATIDTHFYLHRMDRDAQAVSLYIAGKRKYFTTLNRPEHPTPPYDYDEIAFRHMLIRREVCAIQAFFDYQNIVPIPFSFESFCDSLAQLHLITHICLGRIGIELDELPDITPRIKQQANPAKRKFREQFLAEYRARRKGVHHELDKS